MPSIARIPFFLLLGLLVFCKVVSAETEPKSKCQNGDGNVAEGCILQGDGDFYGTGVRMGIYAQWLTSWLANNFLPEEISGSLETNSIFLLALFATVFTYSVQTDQIRVVDVLIIHQLCVGFLFSIMSLWGYRTMYYKTEGPGGRRHFGGWGTHLRLVLMSAITSYGVWFWLRGIDVLPSCDQRLACGGLETWFFTSMRVKSKVTRSLNLAVACGAALYYGIMSLTAAIAGLIYTTRKLRGKENAWELIERPDGDVSLDKRELTIWYIVLSIFNLFWLIFSMILIEFTLNLNHMNNTIGTGSIKGAGQLIPVLIGMISLGKVLYELACLHIPWMKKRQEEEDTSQNGYNVVSPTAESKHTQGLGLNKGAYSAAAQQDDLENAGAVATSLHRSAKTTRRPQRRRSLTHRILLAWLPWLSMFKWSRQSLTPQIIRNSSLFGAAGFQHDRKRDATAGFEVLGVKKMRVNEEQDARQRIGHVRGQSSIMTNSTDDSPSMALLVSPSQIIKPQATGLMAEMTDQIDIELSERRSTDHRRNSSETLNAGDTGVYEGNGYDDPRV